VEVSVRRAKLTGMRPAIKAGLRVVWRNRDTLQIGVDPRRAVALTGMRGAAGLIRLLDGSREHAQVLAAARDQGIAPAAADRIIALLASAGAVADYPADALCGLPDGPRARLACELATVSLAHGYTDGGVSVLARRQAASVRIYGVGPVASGIASLLTASGVGHVISTGPVGQFVARHELADRPPIRRSRSRRGPEPTETVLPGCAAAQSAAPRAPGGQSGRGRAGHVRRPDLVVLGDSYRPELPGALVADGIVHVAATASEAIGVVGPLVMPAQTACLSCVDLTRADCDPAWPLILAQLAGQEAQPAACDAVLAAAVAAQATAQALTFLDRAGPAEAVLNGTLELVLPGWQWRRRSWLPHPQCRCSTRSGTCPRM
jgi:hypothetical protein